jgi:uncharacterized membrane protein YqiK
MDALFESALDNIWWGVGALLLLALLFWWLKGWRNIGSDEQGLVERNWGGRSLASGQLVALQGERGYQAKTLAPGWQWIPWLIYSVKHEPIVQVGADEEGLIVAQIGQSLPVGVRTAPYSPAFGDYEDLDAFLKNGGMKGKQRWVLRPGAYRIHPVAFLVLTPRTIYGIPMDPHLSGKERRTLTLGDFHLSADQVRPTVVAPRPIDERALEHEMEQSERSDPRKRGPGGAGDSSGRRTRLVNQMGIVTSQEGSALEDGQLAGRLGGYSDIEKEADPKKRINIILNNRNGPHKAYQDFDSFLREGGRTGLQHDPVTEGTYYFNPWLVSVEQLPVLHVMEGEVAVIKSKVGLIEQDISGAEFKFGSIVMPGHRGLWSEPIRTGSWLLNPRCYEASIVPTKILTLYWADQINAAGSLDRDLKTIKAKSKDGFEFAVELQVQIHISDVRAPRVISMVGSVQNLVNEVLQSAVGNYFRNKIQSMAATEFIQQRDRVQEEAFLYIKKNLDKYEVETLGVFLQDIMFPEELSVVLREREIATQEAETYQQQKKAQDQRIETEQAKGRADQQGELAKSEVNIMIVQNLAEAKKRQAEGEAYFTKATGEGQAAAIRATGTAEADAAKAKGLALAAGLEAQKHAVGEHATLLVNVIKAIADGKVKVTPEILVNGGGDGSSQGLLSLVMGQLTGVIKPSAPGERGQ